MNVLTYLFKGRCMLLQRNINGSVTDDKANVFSVWLVHIYNYRKINKTAVELRVLCIYLLTNKALFSVRSRIDVSFISLD